VCQCDVGWIAPVLWQLLRIRQVLLLLLLLLLHHHGVVHVVGVRLRHQHLLKLVLLLRLVHRMLCTAVDSCS
jgi:hypothetical protein